MARNFVDKQVNLLETRFDNNLILPPECRECNVTHLIKYHKNLSTFVACLITEPSVHKKAIFVTKSQRGGIW